MIRLVLPYPISANRYWRQFFNPKTKHVMSGPSQEAQQYKREVEWIARKAGVRPLQGFVLLRLFLIPHRPLDADKRARQDPELWPLSVQSLDLGNCEKVASDALNGIAWNDDRQIERIELERMEPGEKGLVVEIEPYRPRWMARNPPLFNIEGDGLGVMAG